MDNVAADSVQFLHTENVDRSVAACWNTGIAAALKDNVDFILIYANDVFLYGGTVDRLIDFGVEHPEIDLWSATNMRNRTNQPDGDYGNTADFCCFMLRPATVREHGFFDEHFRPAYYEDNDYYGRIILGGGHCAHVHNAYVDHLGSQTIKIDPEAAHHVKHWFAVNERRMLDKWKTPRVAKNPEEVLQLYAKHPWGDELMPLSWWDRD
jgi:GT2 family glycosyltransferase